jgi:phage portal protein BeeE
MTAVLSGSVTYTPVNVKPVDQAMDIMRQHSLVDIAHLFNMSAYQLDASVNSQVYSNIQDERQSYVDRTLRPISELLWGQLSDLLPYGQRLVQDWRGFLLANTNDRLGYYERMSALGVITPEWIAEQEGLQRLEGGRFDD